MKIEKMKIVTNLFNLEDVIEKIKKIEKEQNSEIIVEIETR